jgi:hypothetical protein
MAAAEEEAVEGRIRSLSVSIELSEAELAAATDNHTHCLVCYSDLTYRGKTPCDHDDICGICHLRLRFLHSEKKCPICKASNDTVIVDKDPHKKFAEYPMWGDEIGGGFTHSDDVGMFFETGYYQQEILPLFGHACHECDFTSENEAQTKKMTPYRLLQDHLRTKHRTSLCQLCVDYKRDFISRLPRMSPKQLQTHLRTGDGAMSGFVGHPVCQFCVPKRFYDLGFLHQHLHKEHYKCHVCEKKGIDNQFFKNYKSLERHFDQQHFMCHDVQCLAARFMVFDNELDLRGHERSVHGGSSTGSTKINLEFRTRRVGYDGSGVEDRQQTPSESDFNYGMDGQSFVPQALPNSNNNTVGNNNNNHSDVQLHPLHMQRTEELRAQAATIRQQNAMDSPQVDSFPTLQSSMAGGASTAPLVGWAAGTSIQRHHVPKHQAGKVTQESFPALPSGPSASASAKKNAMRGNMGGARRQFAAMTTSVSQAQSQPSWQGGAPTPGQSSNFLSPPGAVASVNRQSNLAADNFPSLGPSANARTPYTSANNFAQRSTPRQYAPSLNSAADFPSMGGGSKPTAKRAPPPTAAAFPSLSSSVEFPAPPSASRGQQQSSIRNRVMGDSKQQPSSHAMSNMLPATLASSTAAKATVEEMKAALGPKKFKELKRLTRDFAETSLSPEGYVDQSAALFDKGYGDADFWSFLPSLVESCPNPQGVDSAMNYMTSLKRQQFAQASRRTPVVAAAPAAAAASNWGGNSRVMRPPANFNTTTAARPLTQPVIGRTVLPGKKKNSWGGNSKATVVRAGAQPGSVSVAAAAQGPQGGSATKFMAKQEKKQASANNNNQPKANGKKKKKAKDELRALAFGK